MRKVGALTLLIGAALFFSLPAPAQFGPPFLTGSAEDVFLSPAPPPPGGEEALPLLPGQEQTLPCNAAPPGGGVLCLPQFVLEVPTESTALTLRVRAGAEFLIFLRFGQGVALDQGRAVADLSIQSRNGQATFVLPPFQPGEQFPGLQAGRYFFAIAHFEASDQRFTVAGEVTLPQPLPPGTPTTLTCTVFEVLCSQQLTLRVDRPTRLEVQVRGAGRFLAYLRRDRRVELPALTFDQDGRPQIGDPIADASAAAQDGTLTLVLDPNTSPPLQAGTYYLALASLENVDLELSVTATLAGSAVNRVPQAAFTFEPAQPRVGQQVRFLDRSSDEDGRITAWSWDFGDGNTSEQANPVHVYAAPGTYRVSLSVTDDAGGRAEAARTLSVLEAAAPVTGLSAWAFRALAFEPRAAWQRALQGGCVVYTVVSTDEAEVVLTDPEGLERRVSVPAGGAVWVCGNVAHFDL